ncbi:uncharacterized protein V2V93DRAFT_211579 [Kockiozyma suomiensis]|uniref:uncharacterized protein n=1 Tax=Kockiozyma suomiensis TaxID=1337062 RepID=UPI0033437500
MLSNADRKRLKDSKYPPEFDLSVDLNRVNLHAAKSWITEQISNIADGDDIVLNYIMALLESNKKVRLPFM